MNEGAALGTSCLISIQHSTFNIQHFALLTIPNLLTLLRLLLIPCFIVASFRGAYAVAFTLFVTAAVTDILDGAIARRLNQRSKLGAVLDPAADKILMVSGFLFYTLNSQVTTRIPGWLLFTVFIRDFVIVLFAYLLYTRVRVKRFPPSVAGKACTVLQAVTLAATIAANAFPVPFTAIALVFFKVALVITLYSGFDYLRRGEKLLDEQLPA
jgi:cardiolipin synthase (CMP-forming)